MGSFKDRFGLGYIAPPRQSTPEPEKPAYMDDALLAYSGRMLQALNDSPERQGRLFDLARTLGARVEVLSSVAKDLIGKGYVARLEEDKLGNDNLQLTRAGEIFLEKF